VKDVYVAILVVVGSVVGMFALATGCVLVFAYMDWLGRVLKLG